MHMLLEAAFISQMKPEFYVSPEELCSSCPLLCKCSETSYRETDYNTT